MAARRIPTILTQLSKEEKMEVQAIYDATGIPRYLEDDTRPFRQPHPMIPKAAFLGGGKTPTAGEITLAHHGILFLDEFMEFKTEMYRSTQTAIGRWNNRYHQKWDLPQVSGRLSTDRHHESMSLRLWIGRWDLPMYLS